MHTHTAAHIERENVTHFMHTPRFTLTQRIRLSLEHCQWKECIACEPLYALHACMRSRNQCIFNKLWYCWVCVRFFLFCFQASSSLSLISERQNACVRSVRCWEKCASRTPQQWYSSGWVKAIILMRSVHWYVHGWALFASDRRSIWL